MYEKLKCDFNVFVFENSVRTGVDLSVDRVKHSKEHMVDTESYSSVHWTVVIHLH